MSATPSLTATASTVSVRSPWAGTCTRQVSTPLVTDGLSSAMIRSSCRRSPRPLVITSMSSVAATAAATRGRAWPFTSNKSAKSASAARVMTQRFGFADVFRSVMSSRIPSPTYRRRTTSSVLSAWPAFGGIRPRNRPANGSLIVIVSGCGSSPFTRSSQRESIRVSRTNRPCDRSVRMSPPGSLMQNVEPSISVTGAQAAPWPGGSSPDAHGAFIGPGPGAGLAAD